MNKKKKPIGLFPITGQPPSFGTLISLSIIYKDYSKIYLCIYGKENVCTRIQSFEMINNVCKMIQNVEVVVHDADFMTLSRIPEDLPKFDVLLTSDMTMYVNHISFGIWDTMYIPRPLGYRETFLRKSYIQSLAVDTLEFTNNPVSLQEINNKKEK